MYTIHWYCRAFLH